MPLPPSEWGRDEYGIVFEKLREYILAVADELFSDFDEVLMYRGTDYAAVLTSARATAPIEYQLPLMKHLSRLLR